jgi:hypothetical protein
MKWVLRVGLTFSLVVSILLLTLLPHVLGNEVFTKSEINRIVPVIDNILALPCADNNGYFCNDSDN